MVINHMKRNAVVILFSFFFAGSAFTQVTLIQPTQNPDVAYRLFNTQNIYTLLKLDTRTGRIWQIQWGNDDSRFISPLNLQPLATNGRFGRFTLYPTSNIYAFILLDQDTGDSWHVQWSGRRADRFIAPIESLP